MAPSPTAEATRFIESRRTSPAANTPGTLVSSTNGGRSSGQAGPSLQVSRSGPVRTKPLSSLAMSAPSPSVRGDAPMNPKSQFVGSSAFVSVARFAIVTASR